MKKRMAIKTATLFQACVVGFGECFLFSNGALMYKPTTDEIRILFLDGSVHEELHIDPDRILVEANRRFGCNPGAVVEPLHYAHGIATFIIEEDNGQAYWVLIADVHQKTLLGQTSLNTGKCVFVRNTENFLWLGERSAFFSETPQWRLRMFDLGTQKWSSPRALPESFGGKYAGQDVCFDIFNGFVYGVQSRSDDMTGHTVHQAFRLSADGGSCFDYGHFDVDQRKSHYDRRYNELKLVQDSCTGRVWVYEIRKEFLDRGYSERICHCYCVNFADALTSPKNVFDTFTASSELIGARESHSAHRGDCGLYIWESDPRRLLAYAYDTSTRTFLDIVKEDLSAERKVTKAQIRSRPFAAPNGPPNQSPAPSPVWPPNFSRDDQHSWLQTFMNPTGTVIDKMRWHYSDGLLVFSPVSRESGRAKPIVLMSFDPSLHVPGRRTSNSPRSRIIMDKLEELPERMDKDCSTWVAKVKPFHLLIRSLEQEHGRYYGLDFGYNRPNANPN